MSQKKKSRSVWIDEEGLGEIKKRMAELEKPVSRNSREKNCWTVEYLARQAYVDPSTVKRLLNKKVSIDESSAISILRALGFEPLDFIAKHDRKLQTSNQVPMLNTVIDWQLVCREMLQEQQEEQRFRRRATEQGFELNVYVPLGLVDRQKQQRRSGNVPMDLVHQLEKEVITRIYQHDEFLNDVIGQQTVGKNKHIAIVGEPGAGKTTLLDNIATYIQKNTEDLPICISLASLQGRTLKNYILEEWLPEAISLTYPDIDIETFHEKSLQKRLRQGGVWLLLDGVDEMGEINTLEKIQSQLSDWLGKVRVVLTCRTNVWDAKTNNPLTGFDTYKTQNFSQEDVRRFIKQWFGFARKPLLGKVLREKLNQPQSDRIRQLVENPLRLALLCQVFNRDEKAELPETTAGLYELFVRYFYEWKPTLSSVDWTTQLELKEELHQALGRLSIAGLDSDARFRLPESLIKKELDDRLFKLAWELGWLNLVDREATTDEPVYAFFHPTFQEYFAALAIDDWHFFLNHVPENPDRGTYRIFESQWKEVYLLWLGCRDEYALPEQKKEFIEALRNFQDDCQQFYSHRSYLLAAVGVAEFTDHSDAAEIVTAVAKVACYNFDDFIEDSIAESFKEALLETDRRLAIIALISIVSNSNKSFRIKNAAQILSKIGYNNEAVITALTERLSRLRDEELRWQLAHSLIQLDASNLTAINAIINLLEDCHNEQILIQISEVLKKVNSDKLDEIYFLKKLLLHDSLIIALSAAENLKEINPGDSDAISISKRLGPPPFDFDEERYETFLSQHLSSEQKEVMLGRSNKNNQERAEVLVSILNTCETSESERIEYIQWYESNSYPGLGSRLYITESELEMINSFSKLHPFARFFARIYIVPYNINNIQEKYEIYIDALSKLVRLGIENGKLTFAIIDLLCPKSQTLILSNNSKPLLHGFQIQEVAKKLINFISIQDIKMIIKNLKLLVNSLKRGSEECNYYYTILWHYAQNMSYPDFYDAWHKPPKTHPEAPENILVVNSIIQNLPLSQKIEIIQSTVASDPNFNDVVKLICIDGSYFSYPNNPATDIYIEMVEQGCPEKQEEANTMQQLKKYWRLDLRRLEKRVAVLFYNSKNDRTLNPSFLSDISTFGGTIAIISDQPCENVRLIISPNDPNLIDTVLKWLRREISES